VCTSCIGRDRHIVDRTMLNEAWINMLLGFCVDSDEPCGSDIGKCVKRTSRLVTGILLIRYVLDSILC
jgi:hypothetical protein